MRNQPIDFDLADKLLLQSLQVAIKRLEDRVAILEEIVGEENVEEVLEE